MGSVLFRVIGTVDGVPRITLEHVTRTDAEAEPEWPRPNEGDGCYRIEITGEPCRTHNRQPSGMRRKTFVATPLAPAKSEESASSSSSL